MLQFEPHETSQGRAILRREPLGALQRRIAEALAADASLEPAIATLMQPLVQLDTCWSEAEGTLGDDPWAAHRLRLHLVAAAHWETWLVRMVAAREDAGGPTDDQPRLSAAASPQTRGLVDHGALVVLGLAAMRVSALPDVRAPLMSVPFGLAVAAASAELLASLGDYGPQGAGLASFMRSTSAAAVTDFNGLLAPLRAMWSDSHVESVWSSLLRLYERLKQESDAYGKREAGNLVTVGSERHAVSLWDGAHALGFDRVEPQDDGRALLGGLHALGDGQRIVFGFAPRAVRVAGSDDSDARGLLAAVPQEVAHGWVGVDDTAMRGASDLYRAHLRAVCAELESRGLVDEVPSGLVAALPDPAMPPLDKHNQWNEPLRAGPHHRITRRAVVFRPAIVQDGSRVEGMGQAGQADWLQAIASKHGIDLEVVEGLPWVEDTLAVVNGRIDEPGDPRVRRLLDALRRTALRSIGGEDALWLVLLPPLEPEQGGHGVALERMTPTGATRGWSRVTPAVASAAIAVSTLDTAAIARVFQRVRRDGWPERPRRALPYLRVLGTLQRDGSFTLNEVRQEERRWQSEGAASMPSRGAPNDLGTMTAAGLNLALLDGGEGELVVRAAQVVDERRPATVAALLPLTPAARALSALRPSGSELERALSSGRPELARRERPSGSIVLRDVRFEAESSRLSWTYQHSGGAAPGLWLELARAGIWTSAGELHTCGGSPATVFTASFGPFDGMRLVACDGWNAAVDEAPEVSRAEPAGHLIRALDDGRFWTSAATARWRFVGPDGAEAGDEAIFAPPTNTEGELVLELPEQPGHRPQRRIPAR